MTKLQEAIAKIGTLPEAAQETIAEDLLLHLKKLERLRGELRKGIDSIERGEGQILDIEEVIRRARSTHERR